MTATATDTPRVYAACLASYNSGILHGAWIDCTDSDAIRDGINDMLSASSIEGAEEWAFHDFEGWQGMDIAEYTDIDELVERAELLEEHGPAYAAYIGYYGSGTPEDFEERSRGEWDSERAYSDNYIDDTGLLRDIPHDVARFFDYDAYADEMFLNGYTSLDGPNGVYVFSDC